MKHIFILAAALLLAGTATAQRFQVGVRGGVDAVYYSFRPVDIGGTTFSPGPVRVGYEAGFVMRLNLSRHVHLQSELNYNFTNYGVHANGLTRRDVIVRTERFEIPVQLGFQFGIVRLFGGAVFRVTHNERSNADNLLSIGFNDRDIALVGGLGLNIHKFFLDFRVRGYPQSNVRNTFRSAGEEQQVKIDHQIIYGATLGFFF